jgi:hypothetical protein
VLYDKFYDSCVIKYTSWAFLQLNKMVDLKIYEHLKLTTKTLMQGQEGIWKVFWSICNHLGKLHVEKFVPQFKVATGQNLQDYFEFNSEDIRSFLMKKPNMFKIDGHGEVRAL